MELAEVLLGDELLKLMTEKGELFPDPNLVWNIDHIISFIQMEIEHWDKHCSLIDAEILAKPSVFSSHILFDNLNVRVYLKALFDIATYYVACYQAIDKLMTQLYKLNYHFKSKLKKPKLEIDNQFHAKAQLIRDKSFIHQDSEKLLNSMDKRTAMSWFPTISHKNDETPSCEHYQFGGGKWWVMVNGIKTETEIDIVIHGLRDFSHTALEQLEYRKDRLLDYFEQLKTNQPNVA